MYVDIISGAQPFATRRVRKSALTPWVSHHPQEVPLAQFSLYAQRWLKTPFIICLDKSWTGQGRTSVT